MRKQKTESQHSNTNYVGEMLWLKRLTSQPSKLFAVSYILYHSCAKFNTSARSEGAGQQCSFEVANLSKDFEVR